MTTEEGDRERKKYKNCQEFKNEQIMIELTFLSIYEKDNQKKTNVKVDLP